MEPTLHDPEFPCSLDIRIALPNHRLARTALNSLSVDQELSPLVRRSFSLVKPLSIPSNETSQVVNGRSESYEDDESKTILLTHYKATTNRMLRVAVNGFFESVGVVLQVMEELDLNAIHNESIETLEGAQGIEVGLGGVAG
ncbi:Pcc1-domain-containing protein [Viridothelium virens]|uniref:Pcc1-domain-containing protein n=1 Tax=Viridothelium virens TaxID=1048519 RepID=A0A6A6HN23_VIRVR|nr:Pcc1-domain-containing protein [Viridothelium virens]